MTDNNDLLTRARTLAHDLLGAPEIASLALDYLKAHLTPLEDEAKPGAILETLRRLHLVDEGAVTPITLTPGVDWRYPFETVWYDLGDGWHVAVFWDAGCWDYVDAIRTPLGLEIEIEPADPWVDPGMMALFNWSPSERRGYWRRPTPTEQLSASVGHAIQGLDAYTEASREGERAMRGFGDAVRAFGAATRRAMGALRRNPRSATPSRAEAFTRAAERLIQPMDEQERAFELFIDGKPLEEALTLQRKPAREDL